MNHQPIAVMLDFMNPERPGRRSRHPRRLARSDEAGNVGDLTQHGWKIWLGAERAILKQIVVAQRASALGLLRLHLLGSFAAVLVHSSEVHLSCDP